MLFSINAFKYFEFLKSVYLQKCFAILLVEVVAPGSSMNTLYHQTKRQLLVLCGIHGNIMSFVLLFYSPI